MGKYLIGIAFGVVAIAAAWIANGFPSQVADLTAAIGLASTVLGFFGVTIGLGTIGEIARTEPGGFRAVTTQAAQMPALAAIVGAILLAAH